MRLPERIVTRLLEIPGQRQPDEIIGSSADPYMMRWFLVPKNPVCNVYLHHFIRSDDYRALHDHPWPSLSFLLRGDMIEWTFACPRLGPAGRFVKRHLLEGAITFRRATLAHRIQLLPDWSNVTTAADRKSLCVPDKGAWTLFITGPKLRNWGFHCPHNRWVPWQDFCKVSTDPTGASEVRRNEIGRGCG